MRIARFYQKTLFGVFAIIALIVALTSALYVNTVDRQLTGDFLNNSRAIARSIADSNVDLIVHKNYSALQSIIDQFIEISGISYVFVVDQNGVIIAHTFVPGIPDEILADYKNAKNVYNRTLAGLGNFSEVTASILAGEGGYVHVGMDRGYIALQVQTAIGKEVYLLSIILILSVLASYGLMHLVSRPLDHLRSYAWHSLSREQHASPPDSSHVKRLLERTDEVGELGRIIRWASNRES
jgi:sensor histidine kinase regulating citrate/malate metabolism